MTYFESFHEKMEGKWSLFLRGQQMEEKGNYKVFRNFVENSTITKKTVSIILGILIFASQI